MVNRYKSGMAGFTLVEIMIVVAVIGVLAAIAYPSYTNYVIKTKRTAMMTDLQNIGSQIQAQKLAKGSYSSIAATTYTGDYPQQDNPKLYTVTGTLDANNDGIAGDWLLTATPKANSLVANDGTLTLSTDGIKCRGTGTTKICGKANEWN